MSALDTLEPRTLWSYFLGLSAIPRASKQEARAARWVAEEAAHRPDWLVMQVDGSLEVDQEVLREFRKRFLS